jgi:hypothetical protein
MQAWGRKVIWPGSSVIHWEIRRGFTVSEYRSQAFTKMMNTYEKVEKKVQKRLALSVNSYFNGMYKASSLGLLDIRLGFYSSSMPAVTYRRTSLDFKFEGVDDFRIGAFVSNDRPDTILINLGTLIAIEDAAQALLALWDIPIGISLPDTENTLLKLRVTECGLINTFVDYSSGYDLKDELVHTTLGSLSTQGYGGKIPDMLRNNFLLLSSSLSRQVFADNLSTLSLLWIIAHEDAHRYCGHLMHFKDLGISEQDRLFDELVSSVVDEKHICERRSAELEADTCATTRAVDYCFEAEFLGFFTDYLSLEAKMQIWQENRESLGLGKEQRLFLMRLISISSILPIAVYECALNSSTSNNLSCYPSFIVRSLNVIFTVASRAMDVSLQRANENGVGEFDVIEFERFFSHAIDDLSSVYTIMSNCVSSRSVNKLSSLIPNRQRLATALLTSFFGCHGQYHLLGIRRKLKLEDFGDDTHMIIDFIRERHMMYLNCVAVFAQSKEVVNQVRRDKVYEDIRIALERIRISQNIFDFL